MPRRPGRPTGRDAASIDGPGPDAEGWLAGYRSRVQDLARIAAVAQAELDAVVATETSPDGAVTVTVNAAGALTAVTLTSPADGLSRAQLGASILAAAGQAHAGAARRMAEVIGPLLGERSAAMTLLRAHLPGPVASIDDDPGSGRR